MRMNDICGMAFNGTKQGDELFTDVALPRSIKNVGELLSFTCVA